jgi:antitoxin component YwqK of YwqJK toxin-antitoxin module
MPRLPRPVLPLAVIALACLSACSRPVTSEQLKVRDDVAYVGDGQAPFSGVCLDRYPDGKKRLEVRYADGRREGPFQSWHANGQRKEETRYAKGRMTGSYQSWHDGGEPDVQVQYTDGRMEGAFKGWHKNGQKREEATYVQGQLSGARKMWHENGQLLSETEWKQGKENGSSRAWYPDGKKQAESRYEDGILREQRQWSEDGALILADGEYKGLSQCGAMQVAVQFVVSEKPPSLQRFKATHTCVKGRGFIEASFGSALAVDGEGRIGKHSPRETSIGGKATIDIADYGSADLLDGSIMSHGVASGRFSVAGVRLHCADGVAHTTCQAWEAAKVKAD